MNLTDCSSYEEVVSLISSKEWTATQVASKCWHYHNNIATSKTEKTKLKRQEVYEWLSQYQEEHHTGNKPNKHKDFIIGLLTHGQTPTQVYNDMVVGGFTISKSVIYKYKRELQGVEK